MKLRPIEELEAEDQQALFEDAEREAAKTESVPNPTVRKEVTIPGIKTYRVKWVDGKTSILKGWNPINALYRNGFDTDKNVEDMVEVDSDD